MKATVFNKRWLYDDDGTLYGVECGYDFCGDHQGGIGDIREAFGVDPSNKTGISARKVTRLPPLEVYDKDDLSGKFYGFGFTTTMPDRWLATVFDDGVSKLSWKGRAQGENDFISYWGVDGFFLVSTNDNVRIMYDAMRIKDISVIAKHGTSGQMSVWSTPVLVIESRVPESMRDELMRSDNLVMEEISKERDRDTNIF